MARIKHPRFQPGRSKGLAGIEFIDGFADVDLRDNDILVQALLQHGYTIQPQSDVEGSERPAKASKRSAKGKPANAEKAPEPSSDAPADPIAGFAVAESAGEAYIPLKPKG